MSKKSCHSRGYPKICFWLSAKVDAREKRFIQVGNTLLLSKKFQALSIGARYLYLCMAMESAGKRLFIFPQATGKKFGFSPSSLRRYIAELSAGHFIIVHSMKILRAPNEYEFTYSWKDTSFAAPLSIVPMAICSKSTST